jgi:hypothetical protein
MQISYKTFFLKEFPSSIRERETFFVRTFIIFCGKFLDKFDDIMASGEKVPIKSLSNRKLIKIRKNEEKTSLKTHKRTEKKELEVQFCKDLFRANKPLMKLLFFAIKYEKFLRKS